jgi:hypothetical protein
MSKTGKKNQTPKFIEFRGLIFFILCHPERGVITQRSHSVNVFQLNQIAPL